MDKVTLQRIFLVIIGSTFLQSIYGQVVFEDKTIRKITYVTTFNGKPTNTDNKIIVATDQYKTLVTNEKTFNGTLNYPTEISVIDRKKNVQQLIAYLKDGSVVSAVDSSLQKQKFVFFDETKKILGFTAKKAQTIINSNTIDIWYTTDAGYIAAPSILGQNLGLVLQMVRNGNHVTTVERIEKIKPQLPSIFTKSSTTMDLLSYRDEIWKSRFTQIPVFKEQIINFSDDQSFQREGVLRFANGTVVVKKVKFPNFKKGNRVFIDLSEKSNGDAYDRTGSVFLIPTNTEKNFLQALEEGIQNVPTYENGNGKKYQGVITTDNYLPPVELMRFFTPFGVSHYNTIKIKGKDWAPAVSYRQDVSDYASLLRNKDVYIGVFIGNYDKGGHKVDVNFTLHDNESDYEPTQVMPLFNTLNSMEMAGQEYATMFDKEEGLQMSFTLTQPIKNAHLRYITTGHGGWAEGDEFVQKENAILLNGKNIFSIIPWREDCGGYRLLNPASGNFSNGLSSSDLSRSNWCPGMSTPAMIIPLGDLPAGKHTLQVKIPQGKPEGGSFSAWNVSGVLIGN